MSANEAVSIQDYLKELKQQQQQQTKHERHATSGDSTVCGLTKTKEVFGNQSNSPFFSPEVCYAPGEDTTSPPRIVPHNGTTLFFDVIETGKRDEQEQQQHTESDSVVEPSIAGLTRTIYDVRDTVSPRYGSDYTKWKNVPIRAFLTDAVTSGTFPLFYVPFESNGGDLETVRVAHETLPCIFPQSIERPFVQNSLLDTFAHAASNGGDVYLTPEILRYQFDAIYWRYRMSEPSAQDAECVSKSLRKESAATVFVESSNRNTNNHPIRHCWSEIVNRVENLMHKMAAQGCGAGACDETVLKVSEKIQDDLREKGVLYRESQMPEIPTHVLSRLFAMCRTACIPVTLCERNKDLDKHDCATGNDNERNNSAHEDENQKDEREAKLKTCNEKRDKLDDWISVLCRQVHASGKSDDVSTKHTNCVRPPSGTPAAVDADLDKNGREKEKKRVVRVRIGGSINEWLSLIKECFQRTLDADQNLTHWLSYAMWALRNILQHYIELYNELGKTPPNTLSSVMQRFIDEKFGVMDVDEFWNNLFWHTEERVGGHAVALFTPFEANVVLALRQSGDCSENEPTNIVVDDADQDMAVLVKQCVDTSERLLKRCEAALSSVNPIRPDVFLRINVDGVSKRKFAADQTTMLMHVETATRSISLRVYHGWVGCAALRRSNALVFAPVRASTFVVESVYTLDMTLADTARWIVPGVVQNSGKLLKEDDRVIWEASDRINFKNGYQTSIIELHRLTIEHGTKEDVYDRRHYETLSQQLVEREMFRYGNQNSLLSMHLGIGKFGGVEAWLRATNPAYKKSTEFGSENCIKDLDESSISERGTVEKDDGNKRHNDKKKKNNVGETKKIKNLKKKSAKKGKSNKKHSREKNSTATSETTGQKQHKQRDNGHGKPKKTPKLQKTVENTASGEESVERDEGRQEVAGEKTEKGKKEEANVQNHLKEASFKSVCWADYDDDDGFVFDPDTPLWNAPSHSSVISTPRDQDKNKSPHKQKKTKLQSAHEMVPADDCLGGWEKVESRRAKRRRAHKTFTKQSTNNLSVCDTVPASASLKNDTVTIVNNEKNDTNSTEDAFDEELFDEPKSIDINICNDNDIPDSLFESTDSCCIIETNDEAVEEVNQVERDNLILGDFVVPFVAEEENCLLEENICDLSIGIDQCVPSRATSPHAFLTDRQLDKQSGTDEEQQQQQSEQKEKKTVCAESVIADSHPNGEQFSEFPNARNDDALTKRLSVSCIDNMKLFCDWKSVRNDIKSATMSAGAKCARPFTINHVCSAHAENRSRASDSFVRFYYRERPDCEANMATKSLYGLLLLTCDAILPCSLCDKRDYERLVVVEGDFDHGAVVLKSRAGDYVDQFVQSVYQTVLPACLCCGRACENDRLHSVMFVFGVSETGVARVRVAWACDEYCMTTITESAASGCVLGVDVTFELFGLENHNYVPIVRASLCLWSQVYYVTAVYETLLSTKCLLNDKNTRGTQTQIFDVILAYGLTDRFQFYSDMWSTLRFYRRIDRQISVGRAREDKISSAAISNSNPSVSPLVSQSTPSSPAPQNVDTHLHSTALPTVPMSIPYNLVPFIWNLLQAQQSTHLHIQMPLCSNTPVLPTPKPSMHGVHQFYAQQNQYQQYVQQQQQTPQTFYAAASQ